MKPVSIRNVPKPSSDTNSGVGENILHYGGIVVFIGIHMMGLFIVQTGTSGL